MDIGFTILFKIELLAFCVIFEFWKECIMYLESQMCARRLALEA